MRHRRLLDYLSFHTRNYLIQFSDIFFNLYLRFQQRNG